MPNYMMNFAGRLPMSSIAKALVAAAIGGIGSLATAAQSGGVTLAEGLTCAGVALIAFQGTYWVRNGTVEG